MERLCASSSFKRTIILGLLALFLFCPCRANAEETTRLRLDYAGDALATVGFLGGTALVTLVPVDRHPRWAHEPFAMDENFRGAFSEPSAQASNVLVATTVAAPLAFAIGDGAHERTGREGIIYAESIATSLLLNATIKYVVQRPRPYAYSKDGRIVRFTEKAGADAHLSFYSGHASTAFAAAVAGSYLYGSGGSDKSSRAALWGVEMTLASATANLRVRAGRHFPSDVVLGTAVGTAVGILVPRLHFDEKSAGAPTPLEWSAIGAGLVLGTTLSWVLPLDGALAEPSERPSPLSVHVLPMATQKSASLALVGTF